MNFIRTNADRQSKSFPKLLKYYMETSGMDAGILADEIGVDERTIKRYLSGNTIPDVRTLVAICIAMHLFPIYSYKLLISAGKILMETDEDQAYQVLLNTLYEYSVHDCNAFLIRMGFQPLTKI